MKVILLTHERELNKGTNTGRLVEQVLGDDLEIIIWKRKEPDERLVQLLETKQAALVFPSKEANLENQDPNDYEYLVILDSTWQEARKMFNRSPYLNQAEKVSLSISRPSEYKLRRNQIEGGLSTVECVIELMKHKTLFHMAENLKNIFNNFNYKN